jgi:hypothetical protein
MAIPLSALSGSVSAKALLLTTALTYHPKRELEVNQDLQASTT